MLFIQTLLSLARRSFGKVFQSIFGWAVRVLFGEVQKEEKTKLAATVGIAALWPILVAGAAFPRVAAFVIAFVPIPKSVPSGWIRGIWIALALIVPFFVGAAFQKRNQRQLTLGGSLAGFRITAGLAAAFAVAFVMVPIQKITAWVRGEKDEHIVLITEDKARKEVTRAVLESLAAVDLAVTRRPAPWLARTIGRILSATAVAVDETAADPLYYARPGLAVTLLPNGIDLHGRPTLILRAHAVIAERATFLPAYQTADPEAQELEKRIQAELRRLAGARAGSGDGRRTKVLRDIARELILLDCPYDEWELVYRQALQLHLVASGEPQLLASVLEAGLSRTERASTLRSLSRARARDAYRASRERALRKTTAVLGDLFRRVAGEAFRAARRR